MIEQYTLIDPKTNIEITIKVTYDFTDVSAIYSNEKIVMITPYAPHYTEYAFNDLVYVINDFISKGYVITKVE